MKKFAMLMLVSLVCGLAFAAGVSNAPISYKSAFEFQAQDQTGMDISFTLPYYEIKKESTNGQTFHRIELPDAGTLMQDGMPELPVITTTIAIPHQGSVFVEVQNAQHSTLSQYNAFPLQEGNDPDSPKAFVQNTDYYGGGGAYPSAVIEYSDPMILRDFRIITIQVNPFSYNAGSNELTVYDDIQLRVNFSDEAGVNELPAPVQYISPSFDKLYDAVIQNYHD
ncbi:MAG: C25 family peptidase propeptide domain-containing protein, partial [Candidatus Cloacimonetes bacterium]|nr:C25 family peptidase propeptide domain-containing protein [Candidatus Cloacimonadota bacterium]